MFSPGTLNMFVLGDSVFMLLKCICNNILIEKNTEKTTNQLSNKRKICISVFRVVILQNNKTTYSEAYSEPLLNI